MKNFKIKSYCKINLFLRVLNKLKNGYHNIISLVTFCDLHDIINISEINEKKDKIIFSGKFKKGINLKLNTATKALYLLRKYKFMRKKFFKINIQKNIPHGSGLGGGSSNAAALLNFFNLKMNLKINKNKLKSLANQIGFDVPINLEKKNSLLIGKKNKLIKINKNLKLNLLIVYPNLICSTGKIYKKNKNFSSVKKNVYVNNIKAKNFISFLSDEKNDLEKTVIKVYPKIKKIINFIKTQKGCYFSRITGSGSACIGIFSNINNAIYAKKLVKIKYPKYWCVVSKSI